MKKSSFFAVSILALVLSISALGWTPAINQNPTAPVTGANAAGPVAITNENLFEQYISGLYQSVGLTNSGLDQNVFKKALVGYYNLKHNNQVTKPLLTIVDFTKSSTQKRLWIIDLDAKKLLFNTLVAHGQGSGDDMAQNFSNLENSHQSSLGFYITEETYVGKHGLSLKLNGMDAGFNTNARERAVVMHGAEYVSQSFINQHGRLGRSYGCPALPVEVTKIIIDTVKGKSCLYINGPENLYKSAFLNQDIAVADYVSENSNITPLNSAAIVTAGI